MPWVRFDDQFTIHRKVDGLSDAAFRLHVAAIFWCARNLTDGFVPREDLALVSARVRAPERFAAECVIRELWHPADETCPSATCTAPLDGDGWVIHDYLVYQPSREKVLRERAQKQAAGKKGGERSGQVRRRRSEGQRSRTEPNAKQSASGSVQHPYHPPTGGTGRPASPPGLAAVPDWCGQCDDPHTRLVDLADGSVGRCPRCHPHARRTA